VPTCSGAGGVNDPFNDKRKLASRAGETKKPAPAFQIGLVLILQPQLQGVNIVPKGDNFLF
tara:strand:+ start:75 stop:257 length:183 start_codon:yes stop_codon:yes gene_type:complete